MTYVCRDCGAVFDDSELSTIMEDSGYCDGVTYYGERDICPECGSDNYTAGDECDSCGAPTEANDLYEGICINCLQEALTVEAGLEYLQTMSELQEFQEWTTEDGIINIEVLPQATLLEDLQEFILDYEPETFAKWLKKTGRV